MDALRVFFAVAESGSFSHAARVLGISPSRVTRALAALEQSYGTTLLRRTTRHVSLTDDGARFLHKARNALAELDEAVEELTAGDIEPRGTIGLAAPVCFGRLHVVPIIASIMRKYPKINVRLQLLDRLVSLPEEGIDIAIRIGQLQDSALHARRLAQTCAVLSAAPSYLAEHGHPADCDQLPSHRLIAFEGFPSGVSNWRFAQGNSIRVEPQLTINNVDACIAAACEGLGITRSYSYQVARQVESGELVRLLPDQEPDPVPIHAVYQAGRLKARNIRLIVDELGNRLRGRVL